MASNRVGNSASGLWRQVLDSPGLAIPEWTRSGLQPPLVAHSISVSLSPMKKDPSSFRLSSSLAAKSIPAPGFLQG